MRQRMNERTFLFAYGGTYELQLRKNRILKRKEVKHEMQINEMFEMNNTQTNTCAQNQLKQKRKRMNDIRKIKPENAK